MDLSALLNNVSWVAVVAAIVVSTAWSMVWYSNSIAGKSWMEAAGVKPKDIEKAYASRIMPVVLATSIIASITLNLILADTQGWFDGLLEGAVLGIGLAAPHVLFLYAFALRTFKLMWIDVSWIVGNFALMGLTIGLLS